MNQTTEYINALIKSSLFRTKVAGHYLSPAQPARTVPIGHYFSAPVTALLETLNYRLLYSHQYEAIQSVSNGRHTVIATPTASGKSLIYFLPVFQSVEKSERSHALFIFPLKALAQDQLKTFEQWTRLWPSSYPNAAIYDGDTSAYQRKKIRQMPPNVLMTNPEMLHLALLPYHNRWKEYFAGLNMVVIDEVHTYRGMFGSHMAQVFRRLQRVCSYYGACPTFVFTSATMANPGQLAEQLSGLQVNTIVENGAPCGQRHMVLIDPCNSPSNTAIDLLKAALARQMRTIIYTQSRKLAELIAVWAQQRAGKWASKISVYRAGLMPEDRRDIEQRLKNGELLAVVTTSALELGIDIGDLDLCILVGYPGSMISTWQRSGRVGRQGQTSALIMIAAEDALDKYFIAHPDAFWQGTAETAVVNPNNSLSLESHLVCAAAELPFQATEPWLASEKVQVVMRHLEKTGQVRRTADGQRLLALRKRPHQFVNLRGLGQRYRIVEETTDTTIGEIDTHRLFRETHPGAVYLHQGRTYVVDRIDRDKHTVTVHPAKVDYYTRVRSETDIQILHVDDKKTIGQVDLYFGTLRVRDQITAYDKVSVSTGKTLMQMPLDVPPARFETKGLWFDIAFEICRAVKDSGSDVLGALHAAEHAAISIMPLLVLADRNDIGGMSTAFHPTTGQAAIFIYDGVPGGAGFCEHAFDQGQQLLQVTREAIETCPCDDGCPACVHSPKCGSGNHPIDKSGAALLIKLLQKQGLKQHQSVGITATKHHCPSTRKAQPLNIINRFRRFGVFDLETQLSAEEVGGWHNAHQMRVSCGVIYDEKQKRFHVYQEQQIEQLIRHLKELDLVIGFNSKRFDYKVLSGYSDFDFRQLPSLDLLEEVYQCLGFRLSLDHLAENTLGVQKNGSGLDALKWWKQGRMDKIIDYCRMDVRITRDLYLFARDNGYLIFQEKGGAERFRVPVDLA